MRPSASSRAQSRGFGARCSASDRGDSRVRFQPSETMFAASPANGKPWTPSPALIKGRRQVAEPVVEPFDIFSTIDDPTFGRAPQPLSEDLSRTVRAVVLAGGETKNPLTRYRAMPAVPLGSSMLMIDVPLNNCLRAGINKIYVLTQFQSHTLNAHLATKYPVAPFGGPDRQGWVDVLAAQQTAEQAEWYRGSADAIRRNMNELADEARGTTPATDYVILSGAAVYHMDVAALVEAHRQRGADITIALHAVPEADAPALGIAKMHAASGRILKFEEKPDPESLPSMRSDPAVPEYLASMGVYVFKREALFKLLTPRKAEAISHIGHHVLPAALAQEMGVYGWRHGGYWHDVASLRDYYDANLALASPWPTIAMSQVDGLVASAGSCLPPASINNVTLENVLLGDGSVLRGCTVRNSVLGPSTYVGRSSVLDGVLLLGNSSYMSHGQRSEALARGDRVFGVGERCDLRRCVVDENVSLGNDVRIVNAGCISEADRADSDGFMIEDGIVVVMRDAHIADGTVI